MDIAKFFFDWVPPLGILAGGFFALFKWWHDERLRCAREIPSLDQGILRVTAFLLWRAGCNWMQLGETQVRSPSTLTLVRLELTSILYRLTYRLALFKYERRIHLILGNQPLRCIRWPDSRSFGSSRSLRAFYKAILCCRESASSSFASRSSVPMMKVASSRAPGFLYSTLAISLLASQTKSHDGFPTYDAQPIAGPLRRSGSGDLKTQTVGRMPKE